MQLLGSVLYDPAAAVNKVTTAALALTALDTTNLRINFTIPSHGRVRVRLAGTLHGATTLPQIMLGVLEGSTVRGRVAPHQFPSSAAATSLYKVEADFIISGLTPGAVNWDAAYGVETLVAATGLKYGGPNNTTANDAFGAFQFELYDPMPFTAVHTKLDTIDDFMDTEVAAIKAKTDNLPAAPANESTLTTIAGYLDTEVGAIKAKTDNLPTDPADASDIATSFGTVNSSLATIAGYLDTEVAAIKAKTDNLPSDPADASDIATAFGVVNSTLATIDGRIDTEIGAIKSKTDLIPASPASVSDIPTANITAIKAKTDLIPATPASVGSQMTLSSDERNSIGTAWLDLTAGVESSLTVRQAMRIIVAACGGGKVSGAGTTTIVIRNFGDSKDRITGTVDANGNRSALTFDLT